MRRPQEVSSERASAIDSLWALVEGLGLTDRVEWSKLGKTANFRQLGLELHEFIRYHSATEITQVYRMLGYTLSRMDEALQTLDPHPLQTIAAELKGRKIAVA